MTPPPPASLPGLVLRPTEAADEGFLQALYASTRTDLAALPLPDAAKAALLAQQYQLQRAHYRARFAAADFSLVQLDGTPVGRLIVARDRHALHLIDIALLPAAQGRGIGAHLLAGLIAESEASARPLTAHVACSNPARAWYARLGFRSIADDGVYLSLRRPCPDAPPATEAQT